MTIRLRSSSNTEIRIRPQLQTWPSLSDAGFGVHPKFGGIGVPVVQANFTTTSSLPSWISFSRTSNATLYDSTGKLTYAPNNLLLRSEEFNNAAWDKIGTGTATAPVVTANAATAPDGTTTADQIVFNRGAGTTSSDISYIAQGSSGTYAAIGSVWLKTTDGSTQTLQIRAGALTFTTITVTGTWTRFASVAARSSIDRFQILLYGNVGASQTVSVYAWGAQLEAVTYQTTPSTYVATTTAAYYGPRFDYDPSTLAAKGLLIEETRTNFRSYSSDFTQTSAWTKQASTVVNNTTLLTTAPDGTNTAQAIVPASNGTTNGITDAASVIYILGRTVSFYAKAGTGISTITGQDGAGNVWTVNLSNGTSTFAAAYTYNSVTNVGNGWYRVVFNTTNASFYIGASSGANGSNYFSLWGVQVENGTFVTSYIPTTTASVTRAADVAQLTGSALTTLQGTQATLIAEANQIAAGLRYLISARKSSGGTFGDYYSLLSAISVMRVGSVDQANMTYSPAPTTTSNYRAAFAWQTNSFGAVANNGTVQTDTSGSVVSGIDGGYLGYYLDGTYLNGWIASLALYNTRLPDAILKQKSAVGAPY